jgi:hypothetical protein
MVNPLLILPLLNSSLAAGPFCWHQDPHSQPQRVTLDYRQCRAAITDLKISARQALRTPLTFGRSSDVGFEVPKTWDHGKCHVTIDMTRSDVMETTTFATILEQAIDINLACVSKPPFLGGEVSVGDHHLIKLSIHGDGTGML